MSMDANDMVEVWDDEGVVYEGEGICPVGDLLMGTIDMIDNMRSMPREPGVEVWYDTWEEFALGEGLWEHLRKSDTLRHKVLVETEVGSVRFDLVLEAPDYRVGIIYERFPDPRLENLRRRQDAALLESGVVRDVVRVCETDIRSGIYCMLGQIFKWFPEVFTERSQAVMQQLFVASLRARIEDKKKAGLWVDGGCRCEIDQVGDDARVEDYCRVIRRSSVEGWNNEENRHLAEECCWLNCKWRE